MEVEGVFQLGFWTYLEHILENNFRLSLWVVVHKVVQTGANLWNADSNSKKHWWSRATNKVLNILKKHSENNGEEEKVDIMAIFH